MTLVAYAGMTHLGLVSALAAAAKGVDVIGFDPDEDLVSRLSEAQFPIVEPGLIELYEENRDRIRFDSDPSSLARAHLLYVAPDVPTDERGDSDLQRIEGLLSTVFTHAADDATIVVLSQVPPGFTRTHRRPGRQLYYQVETLIFGRAVERALKPERFMVGCENQEDSLPSGYAAFLGLFGCPVLRMRYESAELAKISINCCLVASIGVANTLAELCERIGADWGEIVPALKLDRRIGSWAYLSPGLGLAGGNLERDLATVRRLAEREGTHARIVEAWQSNSFHCREWVFRVLQAEILGNEPDAQIGVLGLAYKENTHSTKNSPALELLAHTELRHVRVFDPVVPASVAPRAKGASSALDAADGAKALAVMTPWPEFKSISLGDLAKRMIGRTLIDPYGVFDGDEAVRSGFDHFTLGRPPMHPVKKA